MYISTRENIKYTYLYEQGRKHPLDTPERKIERRERQ